jgi:transposase-like protein
VISVAVRWYLRYGLSYRDVEELLAERGIRVDHVTVYRWVQKFTAELIEAARPCRRLPGNRWFVDETYVRVAGRWTYLYRAIDEYGQVIDVMLSTRRDLTAARAFFTRALAVGDRPVEVTTDQRNGATWQRATPREQALGRGIRPLTRREDQTPSRVRRAAGPDAEADRSYGRCRRPPHWPPRTRATDLDAANVLLNGWAVGGSKPEPAD